MVPGADNVREGCVYDRYGLVTLLVVALFLIAVPVVKSCFMHARLLQPLRRPAYRARMAAQPNRAKLAKTTKPAAKPFPVVAALCGGAIAAGVLGFVVLGLMIANQGKKESVAINTQPAQPTAERDIENKTGDAETVVKKPDLREELPQPVGFARDDAKPREYTEAAGRELVKEFDKNPLVAAKKYNGTKWEMRGRVTFFRTPHSVMLSTEFMNLPIGLESKEEVEKIEKGTAYSFTVTMSAGGIGQVAFRDAKVGGVIKDFKSIEDRKAEERKKEYDRTHRKP